MLYSDPITEKLTTILSKKKFPFQTQRLEVTLKKNNIVRALMSEVRNDFCRTNWNCVQPIKVRIRSPKTDRGTLFQNWFNKVSKYQSWASAHQSCPEIYFRIFSLFLHLASRAWICLLVSSKSQDLSMLFVRQSLAIHNNDRLLITKVSISGIKFNKIPHIFKCGVNVSLNSLDIRARGQHRQQISQFYIS
ncbi:hypothetical protein CDAR_546691 [Caerostris darwini]|uniref:Uncharacterized protein n=1 Tax=Caerostris darwini TaxID=1538125 RepID=A0AAV4UB95_9ARAC|nr:hypothetical protein CDAR_546691 [Caerostris darwini]